MVEKYNNKYVGVPHPFLGEKWANTAAGHRCSSGQWGRIPILLLEEQSDGASKAGQVS